MARWGTGLDMAGDLEDESDGYIKTCHAQWPLEDITAGGEVPSAP